MNGPVVNNDGNLAPSASGAVRHPRLVAQVAPLEGCAAGPAAGCTLLPPTWAAPLRESPVSTAYGCLGAADPLAAIAAMAAGFHGRARTHGGGAVRRVK
jgi:hypothetical protein